jgi:uncharacterized protein (DUF305 family)
MEETRKESSMRTRIQTRPWFIAGPVLLIIAVILVACGGNTSPDTSGMNHGTSAAPSAMAGMDSTTNAPIDQQFIDMMVPHHQGAVAMAQIAVTRSEHPEIRQLANGIIDSQNGEITQMKQWRMQWFGSEQTPSMESMPMMPGMDMTAMHAMNMMQDIRNLQTETPFDKAFIQSMIPHHQSAIDAAKVAQAKAEHPEIKTLAGNIITAQQKEIDQMQAWLKAWYGQ